MEKVEEVGADIACLSVLLTTTMPVMEDVIKEFKNTGIREKYFFMIDGAPVSQKYAEQVGADA